ncbi:hypothetical protein BW716_05980 [[Flexibacter] sp. ATCC 35208]|nr:hypothetical protein BW716_05980 [[Flexibacter] sp. ATCC 35208]
MKWKLTLVLVLMVSVVSMYGQPSFKRGYVVLKNADTLRGFIYFNYYKGPLFDVRFRRRAEAADSNLKSDDICFLWIKGQGKFISAPTLLVSNDFHAEGEVVYLNYVPVMVILKELVKGANYSLYKMETRNPRYFIRYEEGLRNVEQLINIEIPGYEVVQNFRKQLSTLIPVEDSYRQVIDELPYDEDELKKVFCYLNKGDSPIVKSNSQLRRWNVGAGGIVLYSYMGVRSVSTEKLSPILGISLSAGYTTPWPFFGGTERLITGFNSMQFFGKARYPPINQHSDSSSGKTHNIYISSLSFILSYRILDKFNYRLYTGVEPYIQVAVFSPTKSSINDREIWDHIPRRTVSGTMIGGNVIVRFELPRASVVGSGTLVNGSSLESSGTIQLRKWSMMFLYNF